MQIKHFFEFSDGKFKELNLECSKIETLILKILNGFHTLQKLINVSIDSFKKK